MSRRPLTGWFWDGNPRFPSPGRTLLWAASCRITCWRSRGSARRVRRRETTTSSIVCAPERRRKSGRSSIWAPPTPSGYLLSASGPFQTFFLPDLCRSSSVASVLLCLPSGSWYPWQRPSHTAVQGEIQTHLCCPLLPVVASRGQHRAVIDWKRKMKALKAACWESTNIPEYPNRKPLPPNECLLL